MIVAEDIHNKKHEIDNVFRGKLKFVLCNHITVK